MEHVFSVLCTDDPSIFPAAQMIQDLNQYQQQQQHYHHHPAFFCAF